MLRFDGWGVEGTVIDPLALAPSAKLRAVLAGRLPASALALCVVALVGLALRLPFMHDSLFGDEVGAFYDVSGHSLGHTLYLLRGHSPELNPPLYFIVAWASEQLFGTSAVSLRLVCLLAGTAAIPLTYALGRETSDARTGLTAAVIVTFSPFLIWYSSEARPYSLLVFVCLLSTLSLLRAVRSGRWEWWALYAASSCAAAYTHFTSIFLLALQFTWALVPSPRGVARCSRQVWPRRSRSFPGCPI